jgi:hypothetical protein
MLELFCHPSIQVYYRRHPYLFMTNVSTRRI